MELTEILQILLCICESTLLSADISSTKSFKYFVTKNAVNIVKSVFALTIPLDIVARFFCHRFFIISVVIVFIFDNVLKIIFSRSCPSCSMPVEELEAL